MHPLLPLLGIFLLIVGEVYYFSISSDFRIFGFIGIFLYYVYRRRLTSATTLRFALALLVLGYIQYIRTDPALYYVPEVPKAERIAVWFYLFLGIGIIQKWRESV